MADAEPTRFRFSLRTLFVVVTVLCVWLGWQVKIVRERREAIHLIESTGGIVAATHPGDISGVFLPNLVHVMPRKPLSWARSTLGDLPVMAILLSEKQSDDASFEHAKKMFPEAAVVRREDWLPREKSSAP